jgi:hypothetical protein
MMPGLTEALLAMLSGVDAMFLGAPSQRTGPWNGHTWYPHDGGGMSLPARMALSPRARNAHEIHAYSTKDMMDSEQEKKPWQGSRAGVVGEGEGAIAAMIQKATQLPLVPGPARRAHVARR